MSTTAIPPTDLPPLDGAPEVPTNEEDDGELVIHVAELLSLADPPTPKQSLLASQSAPSLNAGAIATDNAEGEVEEVIATPVVEPPVRNQRRSLGKRSITLGGRVKSTTALYTTSETLAHLDRNFSNILMLVTRSLDALCTAFTGSQSKNDQPRAINLSRSLVSHLSEVNVVITTVTNQLDGVTKIASASNVPDTVEEGLASAKLTVSVLLPKFKKMIKASEEEGAAIEKIEVGLLDHVDDALSDSAEVMDSLGAWLKEAGFGNAAGAIMLAMRWKKKAFGGGKSRAGAGRRRFGSIQINPEGEVEGGTESREASVQGKGGDDLIEAALAAGQAAAVAEAAKGAAGEPKTGGGETE